MEDILLYLENILYLFCHFQRLSKYHIYCHLELQTVTAIKKISLQHRPREYERVFLPLSKAADTPFHI